MIKFAVEAWAKFATGKMQREDPNKDGLGKGTTQRFMESNFTELDDYSVDKLENLLENVLDPTTCEDKYIKHFESWFGITVFPSFLLNNIRRKVIKHAHYFYKAKATRRGYESLFNLIATSVVFTETHNDFSFDSPVTFDDPIRRFDMGKCFGCSAYTIALTQNLSITTFNDYLRGCYSIIKFNHPIGANLTSATVGGVEIAEEMLNQYVIQGGTASDITDLDGYYNFVNNGNIINSNRIEANLRVVNKTIILNL